jgi:hypothetical protein
VSIVVSKPSLTCVVKLCATRRRRLTWLMSTKQMEAWSLFKIKPSTLLHQWRTFTQSTRWPRRMLLIRTNMRLVRDKSSNLTYLARPIIIICFPLKIISSRQKGLHQHQASRRNTKIWRFHEATRKKRWPKPARATREASTFQDLSYEMMTFWLL